MGYIKGKLKLREKMTQDELREKIQELAHPILKEMFGKKGGFLFQGLESNIQSWLHMNKSFSGVTLVSTAKTKSLKDEAKISCIRIYGECAKQRGEEKTDHYKPLAEIFDGHIHRTKSPDIYFKDGEMYIGDEGKAKLDAYKQKQKDVLNQDISPISETAEELEDEEEEEEERD